MLCAGVERNVDKTICKGDSGGPLTVEINQQAVLIGDVSFFLENPRNKAKCVGPYTIFGNIANLRNWIVHTMQINDGTIGSGCAGESFFKD